MSIGNFYETKKQPAFFLEECCLGTKAKFHGPAFAGLETTERLRDEQIEARARELLG